MVKQITDLTTDRDAALRLNEEIKSQWRATEQALGNQNRATIRLGNERDALKQQVAGLEGELEAQRKATGRAQQHVVETAQEREALRQQLAKTERELAEAREKLDWQNQPNRNLPVRGGYEFYVNEEWTCLRDAVMDTDPGFRASLLKVRFDPDDERVRIRKVLDDDAILADLATEKAARLAAEAEVAVRKFDDMLFGVFGGDDQGVAWAKAFFSLVAMSPEAKEAAVFNEQLNSNTRNLVGRFAVALANKLQAAEEKYRFSDGWMSPDWQDECRRQLLAHVEKGDPRDVAAYCAFMWHHGWSTSALATPATAAQPDGGAV